MQLPINGIRKPSKLPKSLLKRSAKTSKKLLPRRKTSYLFWLSLSSCSYINFPNAMSKWRPLQHVSCTLSLRFVFTVWKWGAKIPQKIRLWKFRKFAVSSLSRFGDIKEVWYKDWKMNLRKPGQVRACFCWITEIPDHSTQDFFSRWSFLCGYFQRRKFCHINFVYILDFFSVKFEHIWNYCGIIGIKIQISIAYLGKNFSVKIRIK